MKAPTMLPQAQQIHELLISATNAPIAANSDHASITASVPDGYTFLMWVNCSTYGFIGAPYIEQAERQTTNIWTSIKPTSNNHVHGVFLCYR